MNRLVAYDIKIGGIVCPYLTHLYDFCFLFRMVNIFNFNDLVRASHQISVHGT